MLFIKITILKMWLSFNILIRKCYSGRIKLVLATCFISFIVASTGCEHLIGLTLLAAVGGSPGEDEYGHPISKPYEYYEKLETQPLSKKIEESNLKKGKDTILIVDDDYSIRRVLREFLNSKGFVVHAVSMAEEALEILNEIEVDLVITNIRMPGMDGLELTRLIKDRYSSRVIIMTGYREARTQEEALRQAPRAGPHHGLLGPLGPGRRRGRLGLARR